jgi:hypothetical protein
MTRSTGRNHARPDHERARELAAARPDGFLTPPEEAWLDAHLAGCHECRSIAAALDSQRAMFSDARGAWPEAPRDLWARTAAAIEAESRSTSRSRRAAGAGPLGRLGGWTLAPIAGVAVIAIAVGAGLLNGLPPAGGADDGPDATPFALAAGEIRVLSQGQDGSLEFRRQVVSEVCPIAAATCTVNPSPVVTQTEQFLGASAWDAIISPSNDQLVVVEKGEGARGVYVVPVRDAGATATPQPVKPTAPPATLDQSLAAASSAPTAEAATAAPAESAPASSGASTPPDASDTPSTAASTEPTASTGPTPEPTIAVTPRPDGAIEIARDVTIVGNGASYSPDGSRFAFSARPVDGTAGPDVYVYRSGDHKATAITSDHASLLAGWLGKKLLVSRVGEDGPRTYIVGLDGSETAAHDGPMWLPTVSPDGETAVSWDGTVEAGADGRSWVPGTGALVLEAWPDGADEPQVLAGDGLTDWQVRWDDKGTVIAVWTSTAAPGKPGTLSLYSVDPATGLADLAAPKLDAVPAYDGFSLKTDHLTWTAPSDDGDTTVQVLAWSGDKVGRIQIVAGDGTTVVR